MNQHLQKILHLIQQDESLTTEEKSAISRSVKKAEEKLEIPGRIKATADLSLEAAMEELEHARKTVEAQNRELEIESSLDRVRAIATGMQKPVELLRICKILFAELQALGFTDTRDTQIVITHDDKDTFRNYRFSDDGMTSIMEGFHKDNPVTKNFIHKLRDAGDAFIVTEISGKELEEWIQNNKVGEPGIDTAHSLYFYWYHIGDGALGISTFKSITGKQMKILERFRNVFGLVYRRYLDIEQAEAQAMEVKIEAALERVRSRSLAMHKSDELKEVVTVVFDKLKEVGIESDAGAIINIFTEGSRDFIQWTAAPDYISDPTCFYLPYSDTPVLKEVWEAMESGLNFFPRVTTSKKRTGL